MIYETATEAWEDIYATLLDQSEKGFRMQSRAGDVVGELINHSITIKDPSRGFVTSPKRDLSVRYAVGELMWYLSGSNRTYQIAQFSKFWNKLTDDGYTANSAYGYRIFEKFDFDQWQHVKQDLLKDSNSRQAVIHIKNPDNTPTKDLPCTMSLQFIIRDNKLHMSTVMRSNDIWLGFPFDVFCFTAMQMKMAMELDVELGTYTHFTGSLHLYERNVKK